MVNIMNNGSIEYLHKFYPSNSTTLKYLHVYQRNNNKYLLNCLQKHSCNIFNVCIIIKCNILCYLKLNSKNFFIMLKYNF